MINAKERKERKPVFFSGARHICLRGYSKMGWCNLLPIVKQTYVNIHQCLWNSNIPQLPWEKLKRRKNTITCIPHIPGDLSPWHLWFSQLERKDLKNFCKIGCIKKNLRHLKTNFFLNVTLSIEPQNGTEPNKRQMDCSGLLKGLIKKNHIQRLNISSIQSLLRSMEAHANTSFSLSFCLLIWWTLTLLLFYLIFWSYGHSSSSFFSSHSIDISVFLWFLIFLASLLANI